MSRLELEFLEACSQHLFTERMWGHTRDKLKNSSEEANTYNSVSSIVVASDKPLSTEEQETALKLFATRCTTSISKLPNGYFIRFLKAIEKEVFLQTLYENGVIKVGFFIRDQWSLLYQSNSPNPFIFEPSAMLATIRMRYHYK